MVGGGDEEDKGEAAVVAEGSDDEDGDVAAAAAGLSLGAIVYCRNFSFLVSLRFFYGDFIGRL